MLSTGITHLTGILTRMLLSVSENTLAESLIINNAYVVILLVSDDVINTFELLEENSDNLIDHFDVISESIDLSHVELFVGFKIGFGILDSLDSHFPGDLRVLLVLVSENDIGFELHSVGLISLKFDLKNVDLFLRLLDEVDGVSTGSDLRSDEIVHGEFEMVRELI